MDGKNSDRAPGNRCFELIDIEAIGVVDVDEDRFAAKMNHRFDRWKRCMRRDENFVSRFQPYCRVKQEAARRPGRTKHGFFRAGISSQFLLERLALLAQ